MKITRKWAMPNHNTFQIKPIKELLDKYVVGVWADPFARNSQLATITNDLNQETTAQYHLPAEDFLTTIVPSNIDGILFDPPYSPRQISECYNHIGLKVHKEDTQSSWYSKKKDIIASKIKIGGICISFGWNSNGLGLTRGFSIHEILIVAHGGAHNDTIVTVEYKEKENE